jgi:hypothetical protein
VIYFVQAVNGGLVKIGLAQDAQRRLRELQCGSPVELRLLRLEKGGKLEESELHGTFAHLRIRGEWFWPAADLVARCGAVPGDPEIDTLISSAVAAGRWQGVEQEETGGLGRACGLLVDAFREIAAFADEGIEVRFADELDDDPDPLASLRRAARYLALGLCDLDGLEAHGLRSLRVRPTDEMRVLLGRACR